MATGTATVSSLNHLFSATWTVVDATNSGGERKGERGDIGGVLRRRTDVEGEHRVSEEDERGDRSREEERGD